MNNDPIMLWVSPDGDDNAFGSKNEPLRTIYEAKNRLNKLDTESGAIVTLMAGEYYMDKSCVFTKADSGRKNAPIIFKGEGDVSLIGAKKLSHGLISDVQDEDMKFRFEYPDKVLQLDLSEIALDDEMTIGVIENTPRFYAGEKFYEVARFPNREKCDGVNGPYLSSKRAIVTESEKPGYEKDVVLFYDGDEIKHRMARWKQDSIEDAFVYGYFWAQWLFDRYHIYKFDAENGIISSDPRTHDWTRLCTTMNESERDDRRSLVSNIPEELDDNGEYYYSRKTKQLYFIPYDDFTDDTPMYLSTLMEPILSFNNASFITFEGIGIKYGASDAVRIKSSSDITFDGCELSHSSSKAARVEASYRCKFLNCDIFDHAEGGVHFRRCGNRRELISSENEVRNCFITNVNRIKTVYNPHVDIWYCNGILVKGNTLTKSPHQLILMHESNDILIEENILSEAVLDTDDASAIYWGRWPATLGIVIRNNYFEKMGTHQATYNLAAIYIDDWATGADIYNNIFYDCTQISHAKMDCHTNANAIVLNNAQFMSAHNNIMIGTYEDQKPVNLYGCPSYVIWMSFIYNMAAKPFNIYNWYEELKNIGFFTQKWREHYKNTIWATIWDYANEDIYQRLQDYKESRKDEPWEKVKEDILWMIFDEAWDHHTEEGEYYPKSFRDLYRERYASELEGELDVVGKNDPTWGTEVSSHIFWKLVYHKLFVRTTNIFRNNLSIGMSRDYLDENEKLKGRVMNGFSQNYLPLTDKLENGESMFVDFENRNFELTADGIKAVHKRLPEFHNISMKNMGAKR